MPKENLIPRVFSLIAFCSTNNCISWPHTVSMRCQKTQEGSAKKNSLRRRTSFKPGQVYRNKQKTNQHLRPISYKVWAKVKNTIPQEPTLPQVDPVFPTCTLVWSHWLPWNYSQYSLTEKSRSPPSLSKEVTQHSAGYKQQPQRSSALTQSLMLRRGGSSEIIEIAVPVQCPDIHRG